MKVLKSIIFIVKSFLGNFYRHLAIFIWSHWLVGGYKVIHNEKVLICGLLFPASQSKPEDIEPITFKRGSLFDN